jgi:hypothetical protein
MSMRAKVTALGVSTTLAHLSISLAIEALFELVIFLKVLVHPVEMFVQQSLTNETIRAFSVIHPVPAPC